MKVLLLAGLMCVTAATTGCASIVSGTNQPIAVETRLNGNPLPGAACKLTSNKGAWFVNTPGSIVVHRGFQDLAVECTKDGLSPAIATVPSSTKAMVFGNILIGGVIGAGVDIGTGAAYDYPPLISVEMGSNRTPDPIAATQAVENGAVTATTIAATPATPATPLVATVGTPLGAIAPIPIVPGSIEQPIVQAPVANDAANTRAKKYQISAETFAKAESCSIKPHAALTASGPGSETYTISCVSGESLIGRCEFGNCRALH